MPNDYSPGALLVFGLFFIPGFVSSQLYALFIGVDDADFTKRVPAVIGYSALHYALTGWMILVAPAGLARVVVTYIVVLVLPILWPPLILLIRDRERWRPVFLKRWRIVLFGRTIIDDVVPNIRGALGAMQAPEAMPWDRKLSSPTFVRIRLKSGTYVGGFLGEGSIISTFPRERRIFIAQAFTLDDQGVFGKMLEGTGVMVQGDEIELLETVDAPREADGDG